jgi:hypothetical protein
MVESVAMMVMCIMRIQKALEYSSSSEQNYAHHHFKNER